MKTLKHLCWAVLPLLGGCASVPEPILTSCPPYRTHVAQYADASVREDVYELVQRPAEAGTLMELINPPEPATLECWYRSEAGSLRYERHGDAGGRIYLFSRLPRGWSLERELAYAGG